MNLVLIWLVTKCLIYLIKVLVTTYSLLNAEEARFLHRLNEGSWWCFWCLLMGSSLRWRNWGSQKLTLNTSSLNSTAILSFPSLFTKLVSHPGSLLPQSCCGPWLLAPKPMAVIWSWLDSMSTTILRWIIRGSSSPAPFGWVQILITVGPQKHRQSLSIKYC